MVASKHELFSSFQVVNLNRFTLVNLNRNQLVSLNRTEVVNFTGFCNKWQKLPFHCWVQYLAGFIHECIKKQWIEKGSSAPALKEILCRTFNIDKFDHKPFKSLYSNPPKDKYLIPFKTIPINQ